MARATPFAGAFSLTVIVSSVGVVGVIGAVGPVGAEGPGGPLTVIPSLIERTACPCFEGHCLADII